MLAPFQSFLFMMGVCQRKAVLQRLLVFEYNPARSKIDHVMFVFVSQVRKKRAIEARLSVGEFKNVLLWLHVNSGKTIKKFVWTKMKCPPYHWHGRRMPTDNRSESVDYGKNRGQLKLSFPASSLELLKHPGTQGNVVPPVVCLALPLSASSSRASTATTQPTSSSRDKACTLSSSIITNKLGTSARASDGTDLRDWKSACGYREESRYTHKMADRQQS